MLLVCMVVGLWMVAPVARGDPCSPHETCSPCLRTPGCAWCADPDYNTKQAGANRCFLASNSSDCKPEDVIDFNSEAELKKSSKELGSQLNPESNETVAIWPREMAVKLRVGTPLEVTIKYKPSNDQPLDVYYLIDVSQSMTGVFDNLKKAGFDLADRLQTLSTNITIGFGSFVDKIVPNSLTSSTAMIGKYPVHGYKNGDRLTNDFNRFKTLFQQSIYLNTRINITDDKPEGASDALAQVLACQKAIGWRHGAHKLLVVVTDAPSHWEGDGKEKAGLTRPHDGQCSLDRYGYYRWSSSVDYPSTSLINQLASNSSINIIFAVTQDVKEEWDAVSSVITGSSVGVIASDLSNIVTIVEEHILKEIGGSMELEALGIEEVSTTFTRDCGKGDLSNSTTGCKVLAPDTEVSFSARLTLERCPSEAALWRRPLTVRPVGLDQNVTLDVQMMCECPCSRQQDSTNGSHTSSCGLNGSFDCGICVCSPGHFGSKCQCFEDKCEAPPAAPTPEPTNPLPTEPKSCSDLQSCVRCLSGKKWLEDFDCNSQCETFNFKPSAEIEDEEINQCALEGDTSCVLKVIHSYRFNWAGEVEVRVQRVKGCPGSFGESVGKLASSGRNYFNWFSNVFNSLV